LAHFAAAASITRANYVNGWLSHTLPSAFDGDQQTPERADQVMVLD
jgi:hypothetical protein